VKERGLGPRRGECVAVLVRRLAQSAEVEPTSPPLGVVRLRDCRAYATAAARDDFGNAGQRGGSWSWFITSTAINAPNRWRSHQAGRRPVIIVSGRLHLSLPHAVVFVVPITSRDRGLRHQIPIASQASGLSKLPSFARPEEARAVAYERLERRIGAVAPAELAAVRRILRVFLDL
jgi:mRNA-degrading endonuclease toxin of MazEF toxin-antitoxin module